MAYPTAYREVTYRGRRPVLGRVRRTAVAGLLFGLSAVAAAGAILTSISVFSTRSTTAFRNADPSVLLAKTLPAPTVFAIAHRSRFPSADELAEIANNLTDTTGSIPPVAAVAAPPDANLTVMLKTVKTVSFTAPARHDIQLPTPAAVSRATAAKVAAVAAKNDVPALFKRDAEPTSSPTVSSYALASVAPTEASPTTKAIGAIKALLSPGSVDDGEPIPEADKRTAVYDIVGATVYMPNGTKLVAHSGHAHRMDNPKYINVKNWGPTPPNVYRLTLREALFHGVRAIRLNPVDESKMLGRDGMLAHSYMLGPRGESNGCISFQDYPKFLAAFQRGEVDRVVVVPDLRQEPLRMARAKGRLADTYAAAGR
jgi:hypothetical protein